MSGGPIKVAIDIGDPALAGRVAALLSEIAGLEFVAGSDQPDIKVVAGHAAKRADEAGLTLTERELEVLALLAEGASNKLIARRLGISAHTAKFHVASIMDKLDAVGRTDAVAQALRVGLIQL